MNISWVLPAVWPGAVYGIKIGIVGDKGVMDIEDTHSDLVLANDVAQGAGYAPEEFEPGAPRHVDFLTSYHQAIYMMGNFGAQCTKKLMPGFNVFMQDSPPTCYGCRGTSQSINDLGYGCIGKA